MEEKKGWLPVKASVIVRTIVLFLALINQILSATGHAIIPIDALVPQAWQEDDATVETVITTLITIVTALIAWWKNNSFTYAARVGDRSMEQQRYFDREEKEREKRRAQDREK